MKKPLGLYRFFVFVGIFFAALLAHAGVPAIFSFSPASGTNGTIVNISGTNFSTTAASNIVYFGAVRATVSSASPTYLTATVPAGATYAPITVTANGLTAWANSSFLPTFVGVGSGISAVNFGPRQDLPTLNGPNQTVIADLDGDGKPDLIVLDDYNNAISIYQNIGTNGILSAGSFAPPVILPTTSGNYSPYGIAVADLTGDGKLDIIVTENGDNLISVYKNNCTPGSITTNSFAPRVDFSTGSQPQRIAVGDLDGDGKPDVVVANTGDGTISILQNNSVGGTIGFAPRVDIATGGGCDAVAVGDLNGDGKPDIVAVNTDGTLSVLQNIIQSPSAITVNSFASPVTLSIPSGGVDAAIVDIDGDGRPDLAVTTYLPQTFSVFQNLNTGGDLTTNSFGPRIDYSLDGRGHTIAAGDLSGDGKPDLVFDAELNSFIGIFDNQSTPGILTNSSLVGPVELATGWNAWGVSVGDLDGDGRPDIIFANSYDNTISIYQNQTPFGISPPYITIQPGSQTVVEGTNVTLCVTVGGTAPLGYQWKFNNANIPAATNAMLRLTDIHPYQAGNYSVVVTNVYGSVTSSNAVLTVIVQNELVYNYSGTEKITTTGNESAYTYSGDMFFVPDNTNGVFVGWAKIGGKKQYWVQPFSDYLMIPISGGAGHTYTILGKAGETIDGNGRPQIWSFLHKGRNATLIIGTRKSILFPNSFTFESTDVYPDPVTGYTVMLEGSSTYNFAPQATQSANNGGQTLADLVNASVASLNRQGYQSQ